MKQPHVVLILFLLLLLVSTQSNLDQNQNKSEIESQKPNIQDDHLITQPEREKQVNTQNIEIEAKQEGDKQRSSQMDEWIKTQISQNDQIIIPDALNGEKFLFEMLQGDIKKFVLPVSGTVAQHMLFEVFQLLDGNFMIPNNPSKDSFVKISIEGDKGKKIKDTEVYIKRKIRLASGQIRFFIKFQNNYSKDMIIQVNLQKQQNVISSINETKMDPISAKVKHVLQQTQAGISEKRLLFKSEIGFKQQAEQHQSTMLIFTGLQLITLLIATFVQLFYLKNLLDVRTLV